MSIIHHHEWRRDESRQPGLVFLEANTMSSSPRCAAIGGQDHVDRMTSERGRRAAL